MIVKKEWRSKKTVGNIFTSPLYIYTGYFLFGAIPIYIRRELNL